MARTSDGKARAQFSSLPSAEELSISRNRESGVAKRTARGGPDSYSMTAEQAIGAASLMDRSQHVSPLAGMPVAGSTGDFSFAKFALGKATGEGGIWDDYWQDDQSGYDYANNAQARLVGGNPVGGAVTSGRGRQPAPISIVPTSTTNPERPRTVAAGYDQKRSVLTVVFRDGTFYNYYGCDKPIWDGFKAEHSKGLYIRTVLDRMARGTANMGAAPVASREQLYRVARASQQHHGTGSPFGVTQYDQYDRATGARLNPTVQRTRASSGGKAPKPANKASKPPNNGMRKAK
jgi:hypothetical protein